MCASNRQIFRGVFRYLPLAAVAVLFLLPATAQMSLDVSPPNPPPLVPEQPDTVLAVTGTVEEALAETSASFNSYGAAGSAMTVKTDGQQAPDITLMGVSLESPQTGSVNLNEIPPALFPGLTVSAAGAADFAPAATYTPYIRFRNKSYLPGESEKAGQKPYAPRALADTQQLDFLAAGTAGGVSVAVSADVLYAANNFMYTNSNSGRRSREENAGAFAGKGGILARYGAPDIAGTPGAPGVPAQNANAAENAARLQNTSPAGFSGTTLLLFSGDRLHVSGGQSSGTPGLQTDISARLISTGQYAFCPAVTGGYRFSGQWSRTGYTAATEDSRHDLSQFAVAFPVAATPAGGYSVSVEPAYQLQLLDTTDSDRYIRRQLPGITATAAYTGRRTSAAVRGSVSFPDFAKIDGSAGADAAVAVTGRMCLSAGALYTVKQPTLNQLYYRSGYARGNPGLSPEWFVKGWLGAKVRLTYADITLKPFVSYYRDKISWGTTAGILQPVNIGSALYTGCTAQLRTADIHGWRLTADYTFAPSFLLTGELTVRDNRRIMYSPLHTLAVKTEYKLDDWLFGFKARYSGERYESNANIGVLNAYLLLGLNAEWTRGRILIRLSADNLLNTTCFEVSEYPLPGFSCTLSGKYTF